MLHKGLRFSRGGLHPRLHVTMETNDGGELGRGETGNVLFERTDGRGVRVAPTPRQRVKLEGFQAQLAARNAALLVLAERGLSSAEIAALPGIDLDERTIREGIAKAKRLRLEWSYATRPTVDPKVIPLFGCQPWVRAKEELPHLGDPCPHCEKRIAPGDSLYCPKCAATGHDRRFARELGEAVRRIPPPAPPAKSRLRGRAPTVTVNSATPPPRLTPAHRLELAKTPQGFLWLKSIGQLPEEVAPTRAPKKRKPSKKQKREDQ